MRIVTKLVIDEETKKEIWVKTEEQDAPIVERPNEELETERIQSIKAKAGKIIYSRYSIEKQSTAKLGIYGQEYLDVMVEFIRDIIEQSNKLEIDKTKTLEDFVVTEK